MSIVSAIGALETLQEIEHGSRDLGPRHTSWLNAFITIKWAVETEDGPRLTPDGAKALHDMREAASTRRG